MCLALAATLLVTACASGAEQGSVVTSTIAPLATLPPGTAPPTSTTTTTLPPTTTTTVPAVVVHDTVNGLEAGAASMERRAVVIKIDNHRDARPQAGLMEADLVYEMLVEGGLTRFAAVFHQTDSAFVGPVRSGRPTDVGVVRALDAPFQVSGAQWWVQDIFEDHGLRMVWETGAATWRESSRTAPHNLFASSLLLRDFADSRGWPDENPGNVFQFGETTPSDATASEVTFDWSDHPAVRWVWNGEAYERFNGDTPHEWFNEAGGTGIVSSPVLVAIVGEKHWSRSPDGTGSPVPTTDTIGEGTAYVFLGESVVEGRWDRETYEHPLHLTTTGGADLILPPSRMWISIFPSDESLTWE